MSLSQNYVHATVVHAATTAETSTARQTPSLWRFWQEDIMSVFARDPAARTTLDVIATYPGVHAILLHRISHRLWQRQWCFSARCLAYWTRLLTNIDIHPGAIIGRRFFIDHGAGVVIGETAIIGDDCTLYHGVTLGGTSWNTGKRHPTLGDRVMIGAGAKILGPITLNDDSRVGANSVVIADVPARQTVVGIPGRIVQEHRNLELTSNHIDLNHHLIPDPVGKAISCLMERIQQLEEHAGKNNAGVCFECEDSHVCDPVASTRY